ncbi:MAG: 3-deoxy-8-phosphooctulonate synthase [Candidatus Stygibacter frigidus]|nr:3-deoxy-8-phosphooctulonate synthase [Candidatus Stygibacter frigidus]
MTRKKNISIRRNKKSAISEGLMNKELYEQLRGEKKFFLIAGPCVIESEELVMETAAELNRLAEQRDLILIFKSSWKKGNRTSVDSYTGPGLEKGLQILGKVKKEFRLPILTDIHESNEIEAVCKVADILQIPAFLSRQTDLLQAAGKSSKIVNIKKGQFMAPEDMKLAAEKVVSSGNEQILLTERGSSFGYHNLVVDFRSFAVMQDMGYPVIYDVTHSLQRPSEGKKSGGTPQFAEMMAKAAIATGMVQGLFIETHPEPSRALSDAGTMLPLKSMGRLLDECLKKL